MFVEQFNSKFLSRCSRNLKEMMMYGMRIPKLSPRPGVGLLIGAVCAAIFVLGAGHSSAGPVPQGVGIPVGPSTSGEEAARFLQQSTWGPTNESIWTVSV